MWSDKDLISRATLPPMPLMSAFGRMGRADPSEQGSPPKTPRTVATSNSEGRRTSASGLAPAKRPPLPRPPATV